MSCRIPEKTKDDFYVVWCEWDIGQHGTLFQSQDDADRWIGESWNEEELGPLVEAIDLGLVTVEKLETIRHGKITTQKVECTLSTIFGYFIIDEVGIGHIEWCLTYDQAEKQCDGDQEPIEVETFEGSNIHIQAVDNGIY